MQEAIFRDNTDLCSGISEGSDKDLLSVWKLTIELSLSFNQIRCKTSCLLMQLFRFFKEVLVNHIVKKQVSFICILMFV